MRKINESKADYLRRLIKLINLSSCNPIEKKEKSQNVNVRSKRPSLLISWTLKSD